MQELLLSRQHKRTSIFHVNRFQKGLFYPVITAFILGCVTAWLTVVYALSGNTLDHPVLNQFYSVIPVLIAVAAGLMIGVIFWTFRVSSRYLGSYERIIREFDEVLDGTRCGPLSTRKGDVMFEELLKRINVLMGQKESKDK